MTNREVIAYSMRTHPKVLIPAVAMSILFIATAVAATVFIPWHPVVVGVWLVVLALIVIMVVPTFIGWWFSVCIVTDSMVRVRKGFVIKDTKTMAISRITDVTCEQGLLDRMFGCGTLVLSDAANANAARLPDIPRVHEVENMLISAMNGG